MVKEKWFARLADAIKVAPFLMLLWSIQTAEAMVVWTEHATVKIGRETTLTPPKAGQTTAALKAAKNESEAFQLIVSADQGNLSGVNVTVSDLADGKGNQISSGAIMIYKEAFMNITTRSTIEGSAGYWPDALIPKKDEYVGEVRNAFPFSVTAGRNQPVWIEVYIPLTAAAGVYTGTATVTASGQTTVTVPIELTVWNFSLPSTSTLRSAYSIDYHLLPAGHGFTNSYLSHLDLVKTYGKANLLHRITGDYFPGPQSLSGGWDTFDARFGSLIDGTEPLPGGKLPGARMTAYRMSVYSHETDLPFLQGIAQHAEQKGWIDRLFEYTMDEPKPDQPAQWQTIKDRVTALHKADPRLRALVTTSIQNAKTFGLTQCASPRKDPCIDLFTPTIRFMDNKPTGRTPGGEIPGGEDTVGNQRSKYGPEVWWYQACGSHGCGILGGGKDDPAGYHTGWPSFMIDLPALFSRVMQWESFKYNVQGELYYDMVYAYGQRDPWVSQFDFAGNGDGTLYYPGTPAKIGGTQHIPIESIRLKMIREGMEDYEYMNLLVQLGEASFAQQQVASVVTNTYTWSRKPADFYAARERMAQKIVSYFGGGGGPVPDPGPTPPPTPTPVPISDPGPVPVTDPNPAPRNTAPTAVITSTPSDVDPLLVHFSSTDSHDAEGPIAWVAWDFGDGASGTDPQMAHSYAKPGTYKVTLTVTDDAGDFGAVSLALSITGLAEMPVPQWSAQPADSPLVFTFDGSQSRTAGGSVVQYQWDFGDNTTATGAKVEHQYQTPGQYEVKLTVVDDKGKSATAAYALKAGDDPAPASAGGKGGGCGMIQKLGPTDYRQAIPYLLVFFAPFWKTIRRKIRNAGR